MAKRERVIGLDIGASSIKLAYFVKKDGVMRLAKLGGVEVREDGPAAAVKRLVRGTAIHDTEIIVSVNCPKTLVKTITVPVMPRDELAGAIRLEAKNYFPFSIQDMYLDFEITGEVMDKGVKKYQVVAAVSPKETVAWYLSLLEQASLKPSALIPSAIALRNLVAAAGAGSPAILACLDMGESQSELTVFKGKDLIFSRKIPVTGGEFTRRLTGELVSELGKIKLSLLEAEKIKCEVGIPGAQEAPATAGNISSAQISSLLMSPLEQLVHEIDRCFDYLREESGITVKSLALLGAGSSLKGLTGFLVECLGIEVKLGLGLEAIQAEPDVLRGREGSLHQFAFALGAALSGTDSIDLLPPEIKADARLAEWKTASRIVAAAMIIGAAFLYAAVKSQSGSIDRKIAAGSEELVSLRPAMQAALARNLENSVLSEEPYWDELFKELSNALPAAFRLTRLSAQGKSIRLEGRVIANSGADQLQNFMHTLEVGMFRDVKLVDQESGKKENGEFAITCRIE